MDLLHGKALARKLMSNHPELTNWRFRIDNAKRRAGCCMHRKQTISLSKYFITMNDEARVTETTLHEIAHALTPGANHGYAWQMKCRELGIPANRCFTKEDTNMPDRKTHGYKGECPNCHKVQYRYKRRRVSCGHCSNVFDPRFLIQWSMSKG